MRRWFESALDSQLAALSTALRKCWQPAVRYGTVQGWSMTSWKTADCLNQSAAAAAAVRMASLLVPQRLLSRQMLGGSQALRLLTAHKRACMHYWADHIPTQRKIFADAKNASLQQCAQHVIIVLSV